MNPANVLTLGQNLLLLTDKLACNPYFVVTSSEYMVKPNSFNKMLNFVCLGIIGVCEFLYLVKRRYYLPSKCKSQTRARWFALFFFCYAAFIDKYELPSLISLQLMFLLIWGRTVHMTTLSKNWRQLTWIIGLVGTSATLFMGLIHKFVYTIWFCSWGLLFCYGLFSICRYGYHKNVEYDHLAWSCLIILLFLIPSNVVGYYVEAYPPNYVNLGCLLVLYLRIRLPVIWCSFINSQKHTTDFFKHADSVHLDHHSIYDILNHPHVLKNYLKFIDRGMKDLFLSIDYDMGKTISGYYSNKTLAYKDALNIIGISYSKDIFLLHQQFIQYLHTTYDSKYFGSKMKFFFCPCLRPVEFSSFDDENDDSEEEKGVELDSPSSMSSDEEIVYAELRDFNSSEDSSKD